MFSRYMLVAHQRGLIRRACLIAPTGANEIGNAAAAASVAIGIDLRKAAAEAAKIESAESANAAAAETAKQRADIRELTDALRKSIELKPRAAKAIYRT